MANNSLNPISRLLDIDFPDIKRSNWNNSFDHATTSGVGFVKPVFVDHIMAGTRAQLDFNSASFANSTIAPLYGRYKVKYLAFWAPDRLYMPDWLSGEKMDDDNYPYPYFSTPTNAATIITREENVNSSASPEFSTWVRATGADGFYIPPTSLASYLRYYPAFAHTKTFSENDNYPNKNAFAFLAFWDAYRTFIYNPQEGYFPVRTKSFMPAFLYKNGTEYVTHPEQMPEDTLVNIENLDDFFKAIKRSDSAPDVATLWQSYLGTGHPLWSEKYIYRKDTDGLGVDNVVLNNNYHYMLPLCTYKPDLFNSFVSNDNVEVERRKSTITMDVTSNGATSGVIGSTSFSMEQWYLASRIQSKIRKNLYKFQDFSQWIDTNFGVKPSTTLTQPMFLGAFESDIIFNDVISTVQQGSSADNSLGSNKDLGSRAAFGTGRNGNNSNFFDFTSKEPGTVMILQMIVPETFYFEGCDTIHDNLNFNEEFNPIFDALGFQDMQKQTLNAVPNLEVDPMGRFIGNGFGINPFSAFSVYNSALAQQPYGMEHMGKVNILTGQMAEPNYYQSWTLARSFNYIRGNVQPESIPNNNNILSMPYSTYVVPEMFNNIFANGIRNDNFQFYLSFEYKKYQPVSKQFLSFR